MGTDPPADIGRMTRCFRGRWKMYALGEEKFVYDQSAARLLKVRPEFIEFLLTSGIDGGQSVSSLLGVARSDG